MKFSELQYTRPDVEAVCRELRSFSAKIRQSDSAQAQLTLLGEYETQFAHLNTMLALGQLHYFLNTADEFYAGEMAYIGAVSPELELTANELSKSLLDSPFRAELEQTLGSCFFAKAEAQCTGVSEQTAPLLAQEQTLAQQYQALVSQATVRFDGQEYTLQGMNRFYSDCDRSRRKAALQTVAGWYEANAGKLDDIFDQLVANRTQQARLLGYESYTDMKYAQRIGYGRRDVEAFRQQVQAELTPLLSEIKLSQRDRLGVESFRIYDSPLRFPDGNPKLLVKGEAFVDAVRELLHKLNAETGEYFDLLQRSQLLDLFDRTGKITYDAFCLELQDEQVSFLFGNFSGNDSDLECLVHEFGHAFAARRAAKAQCWQCLRDGGQDICETHAVTMELITAPFDRAFFSPEDLKKYRRKQLEYAVYFISSICVMDEFQCEVYDHPAWTPAQRNDAYERIYKKYNPYIDYTDLPFQSWGSMWQDVLVIYAMPFYMIDYALAQTLALEFYAESMSDFDAAWTRYLKFTDYGGSLSFPDLAQACGLASPFAPNSLAPVLQFVRTQLFRQV